MVDQTLRIRALKRNDTAEYNGKTKNMPFVERETLCDYGLLVRLRIRLLISMRLTAEKLKLMRLYGWKVLCT